MIASYKKDLRSRAWKNGIFWAVVFGFTAFLQLFFQGYYVNYASIVHPTPTSKREFLKPFGIVDLHITPSPDAVYVGKRGYVNNSKEIFDLGNYTVSIYESGYLAPEFPISITAKDPFYTRRLSLVKSPEYRSTGFEFSRMELVDNAIYAVSPNHTLFILDRDLEVLRALQLTEQNYIGGGYFTNGFLLLSYDYVSGQFRVVSTPGDARWAVCPDWEMYGDMPYCRSTGKILDLRQRIGEDEKIVRVTPAIVFTDKSIYNTTAYGDWRSYEYANPVLTSPDALVHLFGIPFAIHSGALVPLEATVASREAIRTGAMRLDRIASGKRFGNESILVGTLSGTTMFSLSDGDEKWWYGSMGSIDPASLRIEQIGDIRLLYGTTGAYVYYPGATKVFRIIDSPILAVIDGRIYFTKEGKTQVIDLERK